MNREIHSFYFKWYTLSTGVKPCFPQSDLRFSSALESKAYLKLTSLLVWNQQISRHHFWWTKLKVGRKTGGHFVCACVNIGCWSATEAFSVNCLRSVPAFAGCFLELNDVYWVLRSTNLFLNVSRYFYDESEFIVASLSPLRGQSFLS